MYITITFARCQHQFLRITPHQHDQFGSFPFRFIPGVHNKNKLIAYINTAIFFILFLIRLSGKIDNQIACHYDPPHYSYTIHPIWHLSQLVFHTSLIPRLLKNPRLIFKNMLFDSYIAYSPDQSGITSSWASATSKRYITRISSFHESSPDLSDIPHLNFSERRSRIS